jgi:hypothetical protein
MAQEISENDIILVSDSGSLYVVKTAEGPHGHHEPVSVEPLAPVFQAMPKFLRDSGVAMAHLPQHAFPGGATCYLFNVNGVRPAPTAAEAGADDAPVPTPRS